MRVIRAHVLRSSFRYDGSWGCLQRQGFGDVFHQYSLYRSPAVDHEIRRVMHTDPILRLVFEAPDDGGVGRLDFTDFHAFPKRLAFNGRQQGAIVKLMGLAIKLAADLAVGE